MAGQRGMARCRPGKFIFSIFFSHTTPFGLGGIRRSLPDTRTDPVSVAGPDGGNMLHSFSFVNQLGMEIEGASHIPAGADDHQSAVGSCFLLLGWKGKASFPPSLIHLAHLLVSPESLFLCLGELCFAHLSQTQ